VTASFRSSAVGNRSAPTFKQDGGKHVPGVPDFFIVGQPKSGTTALHEMLRRHPEVYMPESKEPWFFADELRERTPPRPDGIPKTLDEYISLFERATPQQRVGEASPMYLWSRTAAAGIARVRPDAYIIAVLREPASLLRSLHLQFVETYIETENDFRKAIALEDARREGRDIPRHTYWPKALLYSDHVRYVEQLERYHALFPPERVLVLIYDDFRADNEATVRSVLRFIGADDMQPVEAVEVNPTVQVRSPRLHELLHTVTVGRGATGMAVKAAIKALTPRRLRRGVLQTTQRSVVYARPQPADEDFMIELRRRYKGEVEALSRYLDRDLIGLWGYDRLG
jgi:sulfotransferase family protein